MEDFWPDTITSMTVEESQQRSKMMVEDAILKTVGKEIPPVNVFYLSGDSASLKEIIGGEMIIITCDAHCAWSSEHAMNDFPKALNKLNEHSIYPKIICLVTRYESDIEKPEIFNLLIDDVSPYYENIYIIDDDDAMRLNFIGGSGRMIVNENQIVTSLGFGVSTIEDRIFDELYTHLIAK